MSDVLLADHGGGEVTILMYGDINDELSERLEETLLELDTIAPIDDINHLIVDMHGVTSLDPAGITFLRDLVARGARGGYLVSFANLSAAAHRAVEAAGFSR
jgi:anti-anti-sigma regulatory factor